jgi:hypothetical protein
MADTKDISMHFFVSQAEFDLIEQNMALSGNTNLSAFLRKMAIDGMVIRLDLPEIREMLKLLRRANANINQIAKHLHETGRIYDTDLEEILGYQKEIYKGQNELLTRLAKLQ